MSTPPPLPKQRVRKSNRRFIAEVIGGLAALAVVSVLGVSAVRKIIEIARRPSTGVEFIVAADADANRTPAEQKQDFDDTVDALHARLQSYDFGYSITTDSQGRLVVKVPSLDAQTLDAVKHSLTTPGRIEFRRVAPQIPANTFAAWDEPQKYEQLPLVREHDGTSQTEELWVERIPALTGRCIKHAYMFRDMQGNPQVSLDFTAEAAKTFAALTRALAQEHEKTFTPQRIAIIIDCRLISAPAVQAEISGGKAQISGSFTIREAAELISLLDNSLQVPLHVVEQREFGPNH